MHMVETTTLKSSTNFRRNIGLRSTTRSSRVAIPSPYNVVGFGCFFIPAYPIPKPSDAICFMYVGSCDISGRPNGGHEPSLTKTVLFR